MRVLLWGLPVWLRDAIREGVPPVSGILITESMSEASTLRAAVAETRPDVVVTGTRDREAPFRGFLPLLHEWPTLRVLSIGGVGNIDTMRVTLIPTQESFGNISLDDLIGLLQGERASLVTGFPTRVVTAE